MKLTKLIVSMVYVNLCMGTVVKVDPEDKSLVSLNLSSSNTLVRRSVPQDGGSGKGKTQEELAKEKEAKEKEQKAKEEKAKETDKGKENDKGKEGEKGKQTDKEKEKEKETPSSDWDGEGVMDGSKFDIDTNGKDTNGSYVIRFLEPQGGEFQVVNIPLTGSQLLRWELPKNSNYKTTKLSITVELVISPNNRIYPIATNLSTGITEFNWDVAKFKDGNQQMDKLVATDGYRLYIHDSLMGFKDTNSSRLYGSFKFSIFNRLQVENKYRISSANMVLPPFTATFLVLSAAFLLSV